MGLTVILDRLSEAKQDILRNSPDDWFLVDEFGWHDNQKLGAHLQQMFQRGLFERKCETSGLRRARYRLTDLGRQGRAIAGRIPTGKPHSQNTYKGCSLMPGPKKEPIDAEDQSAHGGKLAVVGQRIRVAREHGGFDQQEFAKIAGFSRRQVSAWERGANAPPIWVLEKLREHCDVDPEWVISGPGETPLRDVLPELRTRDGILRLEAEKLVRAAKITSEETVIAVLALLRLAPPGCERMAKIHIQNLLARMAAPSECSQIVPS